MEPKALGPPSVLALFTAERGMAVVYREGNDQQGNLFPYTVGLPFAAALYDLAGPEGAARLREFIFRVVADRVELEEALKAEFPEPPALDRS